MIITQMFLTDFLFNCYSTTSILSYFIDYVTIIDVIAMLPAYLLIANISSNSVNFLRCFRILRLMRMFRTVKAIKTLNPVKRQVLNLVVTLISMIYLAASIIQVVEDDVHQLQLKCKYINAMTNYQPSCSMFNLFYSNNCDCKINLCTSYYQYDNENHKPEGM